MLGINALRIVAVIFSLYYAVRIRLFAVINYGRVIHEFDPWFNYRATEYMVENGWDNFQAWYDEKVWYPLGRHVGSTTYPGLQLTSWLLFYVCNLFTTISLNDVCVLLPAGFGAVATAFTGLLSYEVTRSADAAVASTFFMAILPAHLMRSVAGGYDNESIAISAIVATFYFWVRSTRDSSSWPFGILAGLLYTYMVAAWGGYIFVLNMIGIHATVLLACGRFTPALHHAYSLWFVIGTVGALYGPAVIQSLSLIVAARYLVGWQPFQSLEQLGPLAIFGAMQIFLVCDVYQRRFHPSMGEYEGLLLKLKVFGGVALLGALILGGLPEGFIGPLSARVRGLFIKHTRTGNPLVDSVAEHQATPPTVYWQYYHVVVLLGPVGFIRYFFHLSNAKLFLIVYSIVGAYFSMKMIRLVLLLSPGACVSAGATCGWLIEMTLDAHAALTAEDGGSSAKPSAPPATAPPAEASGSRKKQAKAVALQAARGTTKGGEAAKGAVKGGQPKTDPEPNPFNEDWEDLMQFWEENADGRRTCGAISILIIALLVYFKFSPHCWAIGQQLSEPQIMLRGRSKGGGTVVIDDFREAYWWLRDKTPPDARVMAWWDYGYQINGVGQRTTIADGNTWNHEHIALLGKCLTSPENVSHAITRHLADYVLIWTTRYAGMYSDDLAKSPHMARIGASVYGDRIGCAAADFHMDRKGEPSDCMRASILWRMHSVGYDPSVEPFRLFEEAYTTSHKMVRIFKVLKVSQESKEWRAAKGLECSSEECYPPALKGTLELKESFKQIHGL